MNPPHAPQDARGATNGPRVVCQAANGPQNAPDALPLPTPRCHGNRPDQLPPMCEDICWPCSIYLAILSKFPFSPRSVEFASLRVFAPVHTEPHILIPGRQRDCPWFFHPISSCRPLVWFSR